MGREHSKCGKPRECVDMIITKSAIPRFMFMMFVFLASAADAQRAADQEQNQQATRRAEAVSRPVYEKIQESQLAIAEQNYPAALRILTKLLENDGLSDYERSNVLLNFGHAHYAAGDTTSAIQVFDEVLKVPGIEPQIRKSTHYTQAQLNTVEDRHAEALRHLELWFDFEPNPAPNAYILHAQILYQLDRHREMIAPIETALSVAKARDMEVKEQWYALLSFAYYQREDYSKIRDINLILIENWPKKQYWQYLANAYRELSDDSKLFTAYDAAYVQGLLTTESELVMMAQLYMRNDVPFKAGKLLQQEINDGRVAETVTNFRLLSQAWSLAQEDDRSIDPLQNAARLDDKGDLYVTLANVYLSLGQYAKCVDAAKAGFSKGGIKNPDHANISLGMCLYNIQSYPAALNAFRDAARTERSARTARQWISVIKSEMHRNELIALAEADTRKRVEELAARRRASDRS